MTNNKQVITTTLLALNFKGKRKKERKMKKMYLKPVMEITTANAQPFMDNVSIPAKNGAKPGAGEGNSDLYAKQHVLGGDTMWEEMK